MPRKLSTRAHDQVLKAALKVFARDGIDGASMDTLAAASGVSKATIYNHWRSKEELCLEMLDCIDEHPPTADTGDVRADILAVLKHPSRHCAAGDRHRLMQELRAHATRNPKFGLALRQRFLEPPRKRLAALLQRAIAEGQLRSGLDINASVAMLLGPMLYRQVLSQQNIEFPDDLAEQVARAFWRAHAITSGTK